MGKSFIDCEKFVVNEKFALVKNTYEIMDETGAVIGKIKEHRSGWHIFAGLLIKKGMLPFHLELLDEYDNVLATVERGFTWFRSNVDVYDANKNKVGTLRQKFWTFKPKFYIFDSNNQEIGLLKGGLLAWNFTITNNAGETISAINKKFNGILNELFTTKDKYMVEISASVADHDVRTLIAASTCIIDFIFKE